MAYDEPTKNVLCTNCKCGGETSDVMIFSTLGSETLDRAFRALNHVNYDEIYEVRDDELEFYLYEPCYLTAAEEKRAVEMAATLVS